MRFYHHALEYVSFLGVGFIIFICTGRIVLVYLHLSPFVSVNVLTRLQAVTQRLVCVFRSMLQM